MIRASKYNFAAILLTLVGPQTYAAEESYSWSSSTTTQSSIQNAMLVVNQINDNNTRGVQLTFENLYLRGVTFTKFFKEGKLDLVSLKFKNCDLSEADFSGLCLHGVVFKGCYLHLTNFTGTDLSDFYDIWALRWDGEEEYTFKTSDTSFKYSNVKGLILSKAIVDRAAFNMANHTETVDFNGIQEVPRKSYYKA